MGILAAIANGLKAVATIFGWAQQRDAEENTAQMKANAAAAQEQALRDKATNDVASGDLNKIREDVS